MTRINSAMISKCLVDEHTLAEHREIKRMPSYYRKSIGSKVNSPTKFTLGTGHIKFFNKKQGFLKKKYEYLYQEYLNRGFNVTYYGNNWDDIDNDGDYTTTKEEWCLLKDRIKERLMNSPKKNWHYYGKPISKEDVVKLLDSCDIYKG